MDIVINNFQNMATVPHKPLACMYQFYHHLLYCLGYQEPNIPVAELLARHYQLEGKWLVVTPLSWHATHNDTHISPVGTESLFNEHQSRQWFDVFSNFMGYEHIQTHFVDANTWLVRVDDKPDIVNFPPGMLLKKPFIDLLKSLDETLYWQSLLTECQMLLSGHILSKTEQFQPINGVWFWGSGILSSTSSRLILCQTERLYHMANHVSTNVKYAPDLANFTNDALVLAESCDSHNEQHLLQSKIVHWYWNNQAYRTIPKQWWMRLRSMYGNKTTGHSQ